MTRDDLARHIAYQCYFVRDPMFAAYNLLSQMTDARGPLGDVARRLPVEVTPEVRFFRLVRRYIDAARDQAGLRPLHLSR